MLKDIKTIIISRTDAIGDVILSLPLAGVLKKENPNLKVIFLGRNYTEDIIKSSNFVDKFISWDIIGQLPRQEIIEQFKALNADAIVHVFPNKEIAKIAKQAKIKYRIGTSHRIYHWFTCNENVKLGRKNSSLHEAQLNVKLLSPIVNNTDFELSELSEFYGYPSSKTIKKSLEEILDSEKFNLILHPKSHGSAREWGMGNFEKLVDLLDASKYKIFITGTEKEKAAIGTLLGHPKVYDLTGQLTLEELISFISNADGLVAASTGPLHIAAAFGKKAIGIYPPIKPMHPGRWAPIGKKSAYLVIDKTCEDCRKGGFCTCIQEITAEQVLLKIESDA